MAWSKEDSISNLGPPPLWVRGIGVFSKAWTNPVFQKGLRQGKVSAWGFKKGFIVGLCVSAVAAIAATVLEFIYTGGGITGIGLARSIIYTLVWIVVALLVVRHNNAALVLTPMAVSRNLVGEGGQIILSSPLSNEDIFQGESLAIIAFSLRNSVAELGVLAGLMSVAMLLEVAWMVMWFNPHVLGARLIGLGVSIAVVYLYVRFMVVVAMISARNALHHEPAGAVAISIFHAGFVLLIGGLAAGFSATLISVLLMQMPLMQDWMLEPILAIAVLCGVSALVLEIAMNMQLKGGEEDILRGRRPGLYGPHEADTWELENPVDEDDRLMGGGGAWS
jgi:hypothetical protein